MAKHKYRIEFENGKAVCYQDDEKVKDWEFLCGKGMTETKLFVNGVGVAKVHEVIWGESVGELIRESLMNGKPIPDYKVKESTRVVDEETGEITITTVDEKNVKRITVLDKDCKLVKEKCKTIQM